VTKHSPSVRLYLPAERGRAERFLWLWRPLLAWLLFLGFGGWLRATFSLPCVAWAVALLALGVLLAWEAFGRNPKAVFLGFAAATLLSLLLWMLTARYTRAGLEIVSNAATRLVTIRDLRILPQYEIKFAPALYPACVTLLLIPPALLLAVVCGVAVRRSALSIPIALTAVAFGVSAALHAYAGAGWLAVVFLALCLMIGRRHLHGAGTAAVLLPTALLLAGLLLVSLPFGGAPEGISACFSAQKDALVYQNHVSRYGGGNVPLPEGRLSDAGAFAPSGAPALTLQGDPGGSVYLRGYVGATLSRGAWQPLDGETLYPYRSLFYRLHRDGFYPERQLAALTAALGYSEKLSELTVTPVAACRAFVYVPHEFAAGGDAFLSADLLGDGALRAEGGAVSYRVMPRLAVRFRALENALAQREGDPALSAYLDAEGRYRAFVYEHYTAIEEPMRQVLDEALGDAAEAGKERLSYDAAKEAALQVLGAHLTYENVPRNPFDGTAESLAAVFANGAEGYDVHYASLAALVLRHYGIPTRYAEGYLVTTADAEALADGEPRALSDERAHAWVEYYHDGLGWLPFEVTPGYAEQTEEVSPPPQQKEERDPPPSDRTPPEPPPTPPEETSLLPLWILLALVLPVLLWLLARRLVMQRRERAFSEGDPNDGARAILRHLLRLLAAEGIAPPGDSLASLAALLPQEEAARYDRVLDLANLAAFSAETLTEEERREARAILAWFCERTDRTQPRARRLWMRFGLWLY